MSNDEWKMIRPLPLPRTPHPSHLSRIVLRWTAMTTRGFMQDATMRDSAALRVVRERVHHLGATPSAINTRLFAELCRIGLIAS